MLRRWPIQLIDQSRGRRIMELLAIVWLLSLADLFFTLWAQFFTPFTELNPLAHHLLRHHRILGLIAGKVMLTGLGSAIFWKLRRYRNAEIALWALVFVYIALTMRWSDYTSQVLTLGLGTP